MLLGTRNLTVGDTRLCRVDYSDFLTPGAKLASVTAVNSTPNTLSTVSGAFLDIDNDAAFFYVTGGANVNEAFTVTVQVKDNQQQTVNDTINFVTLSP